MDMPYRLVSCFLSIFLCCLVFPAPAKNIRIETLKGNEITPYYDEMIHFCHQIYRSYPYFYNGEDSEYAAYLKAYSQSNETIICLAFDDQEMVGLAIGTPMSKTRALYQQVLLEKGYDISSFFYLGEFGLKPSYWGMGIEDSLYSHIEQFAKAEGVYEKIGCWEIKSEFHAFPPSPSYTLTKEFLEKVGFTYHPDLNFQICWTHVGDIHETAHSAVYSLKHLE